MPVHYAWTLTTGARSFHEAHGRATALGQLDAAEAVARAQGALLVQEGVTDCGGAGSTGLAWGGGRPTFSFALSAMGQNCDA
jgi:hypothetical protein